MKVNIDTTKKTIILSGTGTWEEFLALYDMLSTDGEGWRVLFVTEPTPVVSPSWITNPADIYRNPFNVPNTGTPLISPPYTVTCDVTSDNITYTSTTN